MADTQLDAPSESWSKISTSTISDALDKLGIDGQVFGIKPILHDFNVVGRAWTGAYQPVDVNGGTVGDYIDDVAPGSVIVLDNAGRLDATVWGDILTHVAHTRKIAGTVIDGVSRDSNAALQLGYPLFSRSTYMRTGKDRVQMVATQVPVTIGGVRVRPGDLVVGDADGVVVVPVEREAEVLEIAEGIEAREEQIREKVSQGARLDETRAALNYHTLQSKSQE